MSVTRVARSWGRTTLVPASYMGSLVVGDWLEHTVGGNRESRNRVSCLDIRDDS